ncbi:MAG: multicopper oxidase domain-containing protein [Candidatus Methanoperedens sp.]|nr:multicopper oxidase domain-containing protein [Candidatus Methanoperedens sp.]
MKLEWNTSKNKRRAKRTFYAGIGFIGIMLALAILFSVLPYNYNVASAVSGSGNAPFNGVTLTSLYSQSKDPNAPPSMMRSYNNTQRMMDAVRIRTALIEASRIKSSASIKSISTLVPGTPGQMPDYFGPTANYANSPLPSVDSNGNITGGIRKFVDSLPGLGNASANNIGQYIPVAKADTITYNGSDYYEIAVVEYTEKMHTDLNATLLRGYVQIETNVVKGNHVPLTYMNGTAIHNATGGQVYAVDKPHYLGPVILASKDRPSRVKFTNYLPAGTGGNLFLPVDPTIMGAGPFTINATNNRINYSSPNTISGNFSQNRATIHLHGGSTPWISDGTEHQWTTPAGENTSYPKGVAVGYVPDMWFSPTTGATVAAGTAGATNNPGDGSLTFYYTNQQSARLYFYHDHAYGITRLNVYGGEASALLVSDTVEGALVNGGIIPGTTMTVSAGTIPATQIPLVIQDKAFLPNMAQLTLEDPTWPFPLNTSRNDLWFPHVYIPNQNPYDISGANPNGRWDYGPWFFPPQTSLTFPPLPNPLYGTTPQQGPVNPGIPYPYLSAVPEGYVDTPIVNGNAYPYLPLGQKAYRFRILNAANERMLNLQLYYASTAGPFAVISGGAPGSGASATVAVNATGSITSVMVSSGGAGYSATNPPNVTIFDAPGHAGNTSTRTGIVTAINVLTPGANYSNPVVNIAAPTSAGGINATATATGAVTNMTLLTNGSGYTVPVVTFTGGSNASATTTGPVSSVTLLTNGSGYTSLPSITFTGGSGTGASANATLGFNSITLTNPGSNYTSPVVNISGGGGTNMTASATGSVTSVTLLTNGSNYTAPSVNFVGGTGAAAITTGDVNNITLKNAGSNYTYPVVVNITGGGGTNASAIATTVVSGVNVTNGGSNYSSLTIVTINDSNNGTGSGALAHVVLYGAVGNLSVYSIVVDNGGSNYTAPVVNITDNAGTGSGATANATLSLSAITLTSGGSGYTSAPNVTITDSGTGSGAIATATINVTGITLLSGGLNYPSPLNVTITDSGIGSGATANGTVNLTGIVLTNSGSGYTSAPVVTINDSNGGTGSGANASATLSITTITLTNGGSNYSSAPLVNISGGGGSGTTANATINVTGLRLIAGGSGYMPANPVTIMDSTGTGSGANASIRSINITAIGVTNGGTGYISAPGVTITDLNGSGTGATANATFAVTFVPASAATAIVDPVSGTVTAITLTSNGSGYQVPTVCNNATAPINSSLCTEISMVPATGSYGDPAWPADWLIGSAAPGMAPDIMDNRVGGIPNPAVMGPSWVQIGTEGGFIPAPVVIPPRPVGYEKNTRSITITNVYEKSLYIAPAERADVIADFSTVPNGSTLILYNDAPAPMPAFDVRNDYYTNDPDQTLTGGAPTTIPGYGPNTRTVMQIRVNGALGNMSGNASGFNLTKLNAALPVAYAQAQPKPIVPQAGYDVPFNATYPNDAYARIQSYNMTFLPATSTQPVRNIILTNGGSNYALPVVSISGGGGTGATAIANVAGILSGLRLTANGTGYTSSPNVTIGAPTTPGGTTATATATFSVASLRITNAGRGYTGTPIVTISAPATVGGIRATATAGLGGTVASIRVTNAGRGYTSPPTVAIAAPTTAGGVTATALASLSGTVARIAVNAAGTGYTTATTTVTIAAPTTAGGVRATARATITGGRITAITVTAPGSGYTTAPAVTITSTGRGTGARATATLSALALTIAVTNPGSGYTVAPRVTITGGGGTGATATATITPPVLAITLTNPGSGYTSVPTVTVTGGGGRGMTVAATLSPMTLTLTNAGTGYITAPPVTITGGGGTGATAIALVTGAISSITLTNGGSGYTSAPIVTITAATGSGATAIATLNLTMDLQPKAIHELFDPDFGRMNSLIGVELPLVNWMIQTTIPYSDIDPPTELYGDNTSVQPIGSLTDGTQIWKITHNGVDTHAMHFHDFDVQLINRVGWDGMVKAPDPNELGWKDTIRTNPLEDIIVAFRPERINVSFDLPNSIRPNDVTMPIGTTGQFGTVNSIMVDPSGEPVTVYNHLINYGFEYVWHCHLLGHEENIMMRPMLYSVTPRVPNNLVATNVPTGLATLTWTDNSTNEVQWTVQRAANASGPWTTIASLPSTTGPGRGTIVSYVDTTTARRTLYYYMVNATNVIGDVTDYTAGNPLAIGFQNITTNSPGINRSVTTN